MPKLNHQACMLAFVLGSHAIYATTAHAYTVSGQIRFYDDRQDCSNNFGSRLKCTSGSSANKPLPVSKIQIWDVDSCIDLWPGCNDGDPDDFLREVDVDENGFYSASGIGGLEDVYLVWTGRTAAGSLRSSNGLYALAGPAVQNIGGDVTIHLNLSCPGDTDGICSETQAGNNWLTHGLANIAASMSQTYMYSDLDTSITSFVNINAYWPDPFEDHCTNPIGAAEAWGNTEMCITPAFAFHPHVISHEMGHLYHVKALDTTAGYGGLLQGVGSCSPEFWEGLEAEEKCSTAEGWASFFASAVWWSQTSSIPKFRGARLEGKIKDGNFGKLLDCVAQEAGPHMRIGNVARFFWDCYDTNNSDETELTGNDNDSVSLDELMSVWQAFPPGTGNRDRMESGEDGRNVRDYIFWARDAINETFSGERDLNCLGAMTND